MLPENVFTVTEGRHTSVLVQSILLKSKNVLQAYANKLYILLCNTPPAGNQGALGGSASTTVSQGPPTVA